MTKGFSFKYYIDNYNDTDINKFNMYFQDKLYLLPERSISSKKIIKLLNINNNNYKEKIIFIKVFNKYFKEKFLYHC